MIKREETARWNLKIKQSKNEESVSLRKTHPPAPQMIEGEI